MSPEPRAYQHRVLFFGVLGALVFRGLFLAAGVSIVNRFTTVLFIFGAVLLWSAIKLLRGEDDTVDPGKSLSVRLLRTLLPISDEYHGTKFFVKEAGRRIGIPLLAVVAAIAAADLIFAVDGVPAVLVRQRRRVHRLLVQRVRDPLLAGAAFLLSGMLYRFHHLGRARAFILAFIGGKLFLRAAHKTISPAIPELSSLLSLAVISGALAVAVIASLRIPRRADAL